DGETVLGTSPVNSSGVAEFVISTLTVGSHAITSHYAGDDAFEPSISAPFDQVVSSAVTPSADLSVTESISPARAMVGSELTYVLTVTNAGPNSANAISLSDAIPAGMAFVRAFASQGAVTQGAGSLKAELGSLSPGATATVTMVVVANS